VGRDPIWGGEMYFWVRETNMVDKTDTKIFVNLAIKLKVGLQSLTYGGGALRHAPPPSDPKNKTM